MVNLILTTGVCLAIAMLVFLIADEAPSRAGMQRFVNRHQLTLTTDNGAQVIAYLRTVRRWRSACVAFAFCLSVAFEFTQQRFTVSLTAILGGLFGGILLAEIRMAALTSTRRAATLTPRRLDDYLHPPGRHALIGGVAVAVLLSMPLLADHAATGRWWFHVAAGPVVGAASWLSISRVLRRGQSAAQPDRVAADNAIRRQSLQTLAASGSGLAAYAILGQIAFILDLNGLQYASLLLIPIGLIVVPWLAWHIATRPAQPLNHATTT